MKINKFFMGAMCAVTLAMVGCEKTPDIINPGDNNGGNLSLIHISEPTRH